jgi:hypothetical protein
MTNSISDNGFNNVAVDCWGVLVGALGGNADNNVIAFNRIGRNRCQGIIVRAQARNLTANATKIIRNDVFDQSGVNGDGITVDTSTGPGCGTMARTLIFFNRVRGNARHGINIGGGSYCSVTSTLIIKNEVLFNAKAGIAVNFGRDATLSQNKAFGNSTASTTEGSIDTIEVCNRTDFLAGECVFN